MLGVDDFAFRQGAEYGSVVVDLHTHRLVDLLPDQLGDLLRRRLLLSA